MKASLPNSRPEANRPQAHAPSPPPSSPVPPSPLRTGALSAWWPSTQALDLVHAPVQRAAEALAAELFRIHGPDGVAAAWRRFGSVDEALGSVADFTNVPTTWIALPTRTPWTVLWSNGFLCDGHDALCWCLTRHHGLCTVHASAHDEVTTFQPGATFVHRALAGGALRTRSVHVGREDARWDFVAHGEPLPAEDVAAYTARRKRDRLDEARLSGLLGRLGATPWSEASYALDAEACFVVTRRDPPGTITRRARAAVITG